MELEGRGLLFGDFANYTSPICHKKIVRGLICLSPKITSVRREYKARETCKMSKSAKRGGRKHTNPLCNYYNSANCLNIVFWFERFKFRFSEKKSSSRPQEISCASLLIVTSAALIDQDTLLPNKAVGNRKK